MSKPLPWISPSDADDMVYDDPLGSTPDFGYALLRKTAKGKQNSVADLARAKLQPSKPNDRDWLADGRIVQPDVWKLPREVISHSGIPI